LEVHGPLEAYARDVGPVEEDVGCYGEAEEDDAGGDGEEGGEVGAEGGFGEDEVEGFEQEALLTVVSRWC